MYVRLPAVTCEGKRYLLGRTLLLTARAPRRATHQGERDASSDGPLGRMLSSGSMKAPGVAACLFTTLIIGSLGSRAQAADPAAAPTELPVSAQVDLTKDAKPASEDPTEAPPEAPPPAPYRKSIVLDSSVGALAFLGQFGKVAPPGPWMHAQLGYELLKWFMVFGEGELAFTDTSSLQKPPNTRAFPLFGFGVGTRFTVHLGERLGVFAQGSVGGLKADVGSNTLGILGFRDAESFGLSLGGRVGLEWYQINRHFALGLNSGVRLIQGFARSGASSDTPMAIDGGASLRYAF